MTKAEELLRKEITLFEWGEDNDKELIPYEDALIAVSKALSIGSVSQQRELLEAYTQFLWTQHNNLINAENNKIALNKFIASNCG